MIIIINTAGVTTPIMTPKTNGKLIYKERHSEIHRYIYIPKLNIYKYNLTPSNISYTHTSHITAMVCVYSDTKGTLLD